MKSAALSPSVSSITLKVAMQLLFALILSLAEAGAQTAAPSPAETEDPGSEGLDGLGIPMGISRDSSRQAREAHFNYLNSSLSCFQLEMGQYYCADPEISRDTQQAINCSEKTRTVRVPCYPVKGIYCSGQNHTGETIGFHQDVPCQWTNGKKFSVAVLLSVFLGWLGIDRFYLGYPAIGLLKFCTFGFMFLGHLVDILLIAIQVVGPSDGSAYVVDYYGAGLSQISQDNFTYIRPPSYY